MNELTRQIEALLFLSTDPVGLMDLADACEVDTDQVQEAITTLGVAYEPGARGLVLRQVAGGWTLASDPVAERAARRLLAKPRRL